MTGEAKQRTEWVLPVLVLLFLGWLLILPTAVLQWAFVGPEASLPGFAVVLTPMAGLVIAALDRRKVASAVFGLAFLLALTAVGYAVAGTLMHPPNRSGGSSACQAHSAGGSNDCPGG